MTEEEPLYQKIEVSMNYDVGDIYLYEVGSDAEPIILKTDKEMPFSFAYKTQAEADADSRKRQSEGVKFIGDKFIEMLDEGLRVEEVIDIMEGKKEERCDKEKVFKAVE